MARRSKRRKSKRGNKGRSLGKYKVPARSSKYDGERGM